MNHRTWRSWVAAAAAALGAAGFTAAMAQERFDDCGGAAWCPSMIALPGGPFQMGDDAAGAFVNEQPVRTIEVAPFAVSETEITVGAWKLFVAATGRSDPVDGCLAPAETGKWSVLPETTWRNPYKALGGAQADDHPVVCVSWTDAMDYVAWLSAETGAEYRLLTEAEWEYAARAGSSTPYFWGGDLSAVCDFANSADVSVNETYDFAESAKCNDGAPFTAGVEGFKSNGFGLVHMSGNAWEWVQDCWLQTYETAPADGAVVDEAAGGDCASAVVRGGAWIDEPKWLRSAFRYRFARATRDASVGFRVARTLAAP